MKKIIALALTACIGFSAAGAQAAGRISGISDAISGRDEIHIVYNDTVVGYEDVKPVNTEGRVMIPFRAALENMGASVDYDADTRQVTAAKGNITIKFTLMDDTIYIDNNGQQSTIKMDVPMIIVQDRTLVPIRFMSNAFGMQVGWDGDTQTVVIMDYDDYFDDFSDVAPNITKLTKLKDGTNKSSLSFDVKLNTSENGESGEFAASGTAKSVKAGGAANTDLTLNLSSGQNKLFDDAKISAVIKDGTLYLKTDAIKQLSNSVSDTALKAAAALVSGDTWYKVDLEKILSSLGMTENTLKLFNAAMKLSVSDTDIEDILTSGVSLEGDANFMDAVTLATMVDIYEQIDKYVTVTVKDNGGYSASINIQPSDFAQIINNTLGSMMTEEERNSVKDNAGYALKANVDSDGTKGTANADIAVKINADGTVFDLSAKINETSETDNSVKDISVPSASTDITDTILLILSAK